MVVVPLGGPAVFEDPPPLGRMTGMYSRTATARTVNPAGRIVGAGGGGA